MLPRRLLRNSVLAAIVAASSLVGEASSSIATPAIAKASDFTPQTRVIASSIHAAIHYVPPLTFQNLTLLPTPTGQIAGRHVSTLLPVTQVDQFNVVGLTWTGSMPPTTTLQVKIREAGKWSQWTSLVFTSEHGPDGDTDEALNALNGTDPLLSLPSDAITVRAISDSNNLPSTMKLVITGSQTTAEDLAIAHSVNASSTFPTYVVSPQGAKVMRPAMVTRAQWMGSYASTFETSQYRDSDPEMGSGIIAGFIHHTATTNSYRKSGGNDAAAQMRSLFLFFTRGRHYKDMGYSFLVDKYGTLYEGRSGCPVPTATNADVIAACDGPSMPAIGAHTAGMNRNTFAISAIGSYHLAKPSTAMINSIARLMAWKIAPYGLNPQVKTVIPMYSDPIHYSQFHNGEFAYKYTISGHRDVGQTVCPGKYLYPYLPLIRSKIAAILKPTMTGVSVSPTALSPTSNSPVHITADAPAHTSWQVDVTSPDVQTTFASFAGQTQANRAVIAVDWQHLDSQVPAQLLPSGTYRVVINQTVGGVSQPPVTQLVYIGSPPDQVSYVNTGAVYDDANLTRRIAKAVQVSWIGVLNNTPVTYQYRLWSAATQTWSGWSSTRTETRVTMRNLRLNNQYTIQIIASNAHGQSIPVALSFSLSQ